MNNITGMSSVQAKEAFFKTCGFAIKNEYIEKFYEAIHKRLIEKLKNELQDFSINDLIGKRSREILTLIERYFYIMDISLYNLSLELDINRQSMKEDLVKFELQRLIELFPEAKKENLLTQKQMEKVFEFFVVSNIYDSMCNRNNLVSIYKCDNNLLNYLNLNRLLNALNTNHGDILASGHIRENIKTKNLRFIVENNSITSFFGNLQNRVNGYTKILNSVKEYYNIEKDKETFRLYISLFEEIVFKNKDFVLNA